MVEERGIWFGSRKAEWKLLSNFAATPFELDGRRWPTVEHCFQAAKAVDPAEAARVAGAESPAKAKQLGRQVKLRPGWDQVREEVMLRALRAKFAQHAESREMLLATKNRPLHEDAPWDRYWGGAGKDRLGQLLMLVRDEIRPRASGELRG